MQQIYRRTLMRKSDFNKVVLQRYWNRTSEWVFSCKFATYFQNTFSQEPLWRAASVLTNQYLSKPLANSNSDNLQKSPIIAKKIFNPVMLRIQNG